MKLTQNELSIKYSNIESKIPSIWESYEKAGIELAQDLCFTWDVSDSELIRVISLISIRVQGLNLTKHIKQNLEYIGLYPHIQKYY